MTDLNYDKGTVDHFERVKLGLAEHLDGYHAEEAINDHAVLSGKLKYSGHCRSNRLAYTKVQELLIPFFQWFNRSLFGSNMTAIKDPKLWNQYQLALTAWVITKFRSVDGVKASIACITKANEVKELVLHLDDHKLERIIDLSGVMQKRYIELHFPFDQLSAEEQVRIMNQKLFGGSVPFGAGHLCYTEPWSTEPVEGEVADQWAQMTPNEFIRPMFTKI